jgi:hypothetical protein
MKLKELKNFCKKYAYRKWITRTAAMKKKLAFTLKVMCYINKRDDDTHIQRDPIHLCDVIRVKNDFRVQIDNWYCMLKFFWILSSKQHLLLINKVDDKS